MKLKKAIEYLKELQAGIEPEEMPNHFKAAGLGIKAMEKIDFIRADNDYYSNLLLPGETED
ncbi:hypothetical protein ES703_09968 [subsurface metagenome]